MTKSIFHRIDELADEGKLFVLATIVESTGSTPRKPGARMIVYPDGSIEGTIGGGSVEKQVIEQSKSVLETGKSELIRIDLRGKQTDPTEPICGGELRVFLEPMGNLRRLLILGAGHVARAVAGMGNELDVRIVVYDDRTEQADPKHFPENTKVISGPFVKAMEILQPTERDYVAIMTYDHALDEQLLKAALESPAEYVGMVGSKSKSKRIKERLVEEGLPEKRVEEAHAPIGIPIGGHSPAEIAISILAEIVKEMNQS